MRCPPAEDSYRPPRIDLCRSREEALAVPNFHLVIVRDFAVRAAWNNLEQIPVGTDRRLRYMAEFQPGHDSLLHLVMHPVNLNVELMIFRGMLVFVLIFLVAH